MAKFKQNEETLILTSIAAKMYRLDNTVMTMHEIFKKLIVVTSTKCVNLSRMEDATDDELVKELSVLSRLNDGSYDSIFQCSH